MWQILSDRSSQWSSCRKKHLEQQPLCAACGTSQKLEVHHIEPFHINPERELDPANLITLCTKCHLVFGHLMDYTSWNTTVVDDARVYYTKVRNRPYNLKVQNDTKSSYIYSVVVGLCRRFFGHDRPQYPRL